MIETKVNFTTTIPHLIGFNEDGEVLTNDGRTLTVDEAERLWGMTPLYDANGEKIGAAFPTWGAECQTVIDERPADPVCDECGHDDDLRQPTPRKREGRDVRPAGADV